MVTYFHLNIDCFKMSLDELMEQPVYSALTEEHMGGANRDEWTLTADAFVKFQVRRQAASGAGYDPVKNNLLKILARLNGDIKTDLLIEDTVQYVRHMLWSSELYVLHATELKASSKHFVCLAHQLI